MITTTQTKEVSTQSLIQTPFNPISGIMYQGGNIASLMNASECLEWATFLQWTGAGYKIIKGSKGSTIRTFAETTEKNPKTGKLEVAHAPRCYTVFNRTQVEKIKE